jgi:hypothetical protein
VIGSTVKGLLTGLVAGLIARKRQSILLGVIAGLAAGFALSALAAFGQPDHFWAIVLPGMLLGAFVGFVTQRFGMQVQTRRSMSALAVAIAVVACAAVIAAQAPPPDPLAKVSGLVGRWTGTSEGEPGRGTVERDYERALDGRFIRVRNRSTYPPQEKNPKGETHQDEGLFSYDRSRSVIVFRQFHSEGFVNQYIEDAGTPLSFTSEAIENIPAGYRARETYTMHGADELEEVFEIAEPGKPFAVYSRTRLTRVR